MKGDQGTAVAESSSKDDEGSSSNKDAEGPSSMESDQGTAVAESSSKDAEGSTLPQTVPDNHTADTASDAASDTA